MRCSERGLAGILRQPLTASDRPSNVPRPHLLSSTLEITLPLFSDNKNKAQQRERVHGVDDEPVE